MTTEERVRSFVEEALLHGSAVTNLADDVDLIDSGIVDSMGVFQLVAFLEREFGIRIEDEDLVIDNFATVGEIAALVRSRLSMPG